MRPARRTSTTSTRTFAATRRSTSTTGTSVSASFRCRRRSRCIAYQNMVAYDQSKQQVAQADYTLSSAQQDLILRVSIAYFDVLLAEFNVELAESQKAAVVRAARAGEAQLRGRRRDDHRHQRSAGQVRLDRRAGDHRAQRSTTTGARRCARSSGACPQRAEAARGRASSRRCPSPMSPTTGSIARCRKSRREDRRRQLRHRDARSRSRARPATSRRSISSASYTVAGGRTARRASSSDSTPRQGQIGVAAQRADLPGRLRRFARARGDRAAGQCAAEPRSRAARRAVHCADGILRRQQRGGVGEGVRAGGASRRRVSARVEPPRPGSRRADVPRRSQRRSRTSTRRAATSRRRTSNT